MSHLKKDYLSLQMELLTFRNSITNSNEKYNLLQKELKEKQTLIESLLQQSKTSNETLTARYFEAK